ncbi:MAG TPA: YbaK/EbsC family protein [Acidimicrobiales bacterium]|nr:YbaK/EbsC family protein [Acidimicrobiales bacterium]
MSTFRLGRLVGTPASERGGELVAEPTYRALGELGWLDQVAVAEIDPAISDTLATRDAYGLSDDQLANCVVVGGRREGDQRFAACVVLASTRADVNGTVRRRLDVRKASFLGREEAVERTSMEYGGITAFGLPTEWLVLVDRQVADAELVVVGSGVRRSKLLVPGRLLAELPAAEVIDGLGL